ncbi:hypothetical protein POX_d06016 [Penicillium oxalicum]|uniref:hypothetical protein n=1 Tax=Penicillium oxalicum TaxID=69781 RepID=UPI0020B7AD87|nr:hypothetical protein POX_d06016 [Penicillium oxalicum]KAI2790500.1 hypothetical protein POX_d06016 [Penicillium oxalicum]
MSPACSLSPALQMSYIMQLTARLKPILGSYCHIAGSLLTFVDDIEIHQGTKSLKIRLLHDIDLESIEISKGDGKNIQLPPLEEDSL